MKKFLSMSSIILISFSFCIPTSFAATAVSTPVSATIEGGPLELIIDESQTLSFEGEISSDSLLTANLISEPISYTVNDYRGESTSWELQYTLSDLVSGEGESTLKPLFSTGTPQTIYKGNPTEPDFEKEITGSIDLGGFLEFDNSTFIKSGFYEATLTTELVIQPE